MIIIYDGNPGQGKTYMLAQEALGLLERNKNWFRTHKTPTLRRLATNMRLSEETEKRYEGQIVYWSDMKQLVKLRECDVMFDDMSTYLDAQRYLDTPTRVKRWLRFHEHYGCDIYGNAQDFLAIDISVRRLITQVYNVRKLLGSRRPSATKPAVKRVWGVIMIRQVDEQDMDKERTKRVFSGFPRIEFLKKKNCMVFDTTQDIEVEDWPNLEHIERKCLKCGELKVKHA